MPHEVRKDAGVTTEPLAHVAGLWARGLVETTSDWDRVSQGGRWAIAVTFEGALHAARFTTWSPDAPDVSVWSGVASPWSTSLDQAAYMSAVESARQDIARGRIYQVNICRILTAAIRPDADLLALYAALQHHNPAPHACYLRWPGVDVASASPELYVRRRGQTITSGPIKGTAPSADELAEKDRAENIMIVDLVRNDLSKVSAPGSVTVPQLLGVEEHPGLVHLTSFVSGELKPETSWGHIIEATFPPGSVTGAPKHTALQVIAECEPVARSFYCGALGWIDADRNEAELAVGIRTFWREGHELKFGTGAGITWGSDPAGEWQETELKAARLCAIAEHGKMPS